MLSLKPIILRLAPLLVLGLSTSCTPVGPAMLKGFKLNSAQTLASAPAKPSFQTENKISIQQWSWPLQDPHWETFSGADLTTEAIELLLSTGKVQVEWVEDQAQDANAPQLSKRIRVGIGTIAKDLPDPQLPALALELLDAQVVEGKTHQHWEIRISGFDKRNDWNAARIRILPDAHITEMKLL